ncbi:hypothetical protein KVR01_013256 [Diaporthe batatas]|uniref:uncharacterized protein n=1 Tax=Diaporthe batatas TaxID=748121 RepID=UPI001D03E7A5|nr:uncharacterized protein KVR01_013256 [Diaporthe batatas]KAG8156843.1 hypothetical protein KVR01_013256 [Diaporthe batatas]
MPTPSCPKPPENEPIAIVGSGCRFPGDATTPAKLWALLSEPRDVLAAIPPGRFSSDGFYHEDGEHGGHSNVRDSYLLSADHTAWDAGFFNVAAGEAAAIDPQQRLLMECVYEALEAGGHGIQRLRGSDTAVYVGLVCEEYSDIHYRELNTIPRVRRVLVLLLLPVFV